MFERIGRIFLWIAPFLAVLAGQTRNLAGVGALLASYAVFAALMTAVIWKIGAAKTESGVVREHPAFLPGVLLVAGPLVLLLGASVTGEPTASRPGDYLLNTTAILVGSVVLISGFVALFAALWRSGQRLLPVLGLAGLLVGGAVWLANLVFRYAVVASGAAEMQAAVEGRAWVAHEYLRGLRGEPSWMEFLLVWTDMLQLAFVLLAFLATAAFGVALMKAGWTGRVGGGIFAGLNLALVLTVTLAIVLAGSGSVAAWAVFVLTIPFMAFILPYFMGAALVGRGSRGESSGRERTGIMQG